MGKCNGHCENCENHGDISKLEIKFIEEDLLKRMFTKEDRKNLESCTCIKNFKDIKIYRTWIDEDYTEWTTVYFIDQDDKIRRCIFINDNIISGAIKYYHYDNRIKNDIINAINERYWHNKELTEEDFKGGKIEIEDDDEKDDHIVINVVREKLEVDPISCDDIDCKTFEKDYRESNPGLHMLYTKWAIKHLVVIDEFYQKISNFSNLNMMDLLETIKNERAKLILTNAAYADADEILESIKKHKVQEEN